MVVVMVVVHLYMSVVMWLPKSVLLYTKKQKSVHVVPVHIGVKDGNKTAL